MPRQLINIYNTKNGTAYTEYDNGGVYQGTEDLTEVPLHHFRYLPEENARRLISDARAGGIPKSQLCTMIDDETTIGDIGLGGIVVGIVNADTRPRLKWSSPIINITQADTSQTDDGLSSMDLRL